MTERYVLRQQLKQQQMMGNGLIGQQQTNGGDENFTNIKTNLKTLAHTTTSTTTIQSCTTTTNSQSITQQTSATLTALLLQQQNARNALGDIGNRIAVGQVKNVFKQTTTNKNEFEKPQQICQPQQPVIQIHQEPSHNNTCVMAEIDDDRIEDVEVQEEIEEDEKISVDESIVDIDEFDGENPQLASDYVKDIYKYLTSLEADFRISSNFLDHKIVTVKMRAVLIDWLIQVHLKFHLLQETLYLCVQIIDAYLQAHDVPKMQLQLVGVTAMFLASKYEEMYVPAIDDFVYMTDNTYTKAEIRQMEISILKTLNFLFSKPLPLHFLRRFSKAGCADPKQHTLAKYFMELSLHDAEFSSIDPSYLAACALCLSFKLLNGSDWNRTLEYYSTYKQSSLMMGMQKIAKLVLKSLDADYKYRAATNKYGASKFLRISLLPELSGSFMKELANINLPVGK